MTAGGFGRKGLGGDDEMARRREAFIASERARQANPAAPQMQSEPRFGFAAAPTQLAYAGPQKSRGVAYLLWFAFGAVSAHRHYLGYHNSGLVQGAFWFGGWMAILTGNFYLLPLPLIGGLWVLADAFLIPSMVREANSRNRGHNVQHVFA